MQYRKTNLPKIPASTTDCSQNKGCYLVAWA